MPHTYAEPGSICPTASAWVMRTDRGESPLLLVHLHKRYGMLLPPGGHVERDEFAWAACLRELREEAGYRPEQVRVLQPGPGPVSSTSVISPVPFTQDCHLVESELPLYHGDAVFAFVTESDPAELPGAGESTDLRWLTLAELRRAAGVKPEVLAKAEFAVGLLGRWVALPATDFATRPPADQELGGMRRSSLPACDCSPSAPPGRHAGSPTPSPPTARYSS